MARKYEHTEGTFKDAWNHDTKFTKWRVYLDHKSGWVRMDMYGKRSSSHTTPFDPLLKYEVKFSDDATWEVFHREMENEIAKQKKKFPEKWKEQKSKAIKNINWIKKMYPETYKKEKVINWINELLPQLRKRK